MGQYWIPVNLDKKEFIDPHKLACGLKLWEQLANHPGTGAALIVLCAAMPEVRGGGDLERFDEVAERTIGRWAGDRLALVGDYAEDGDLPTQFEARRIVDKCYGDEEGNPPEWTDISEDVCHVIAHELDGEYYGTGVRDFKTKEDVVLGTMQEKGV